MNTTLTIQIYYFHILTVIYSLLHGFIWNQFDQFPIGLLAWVVEHCTGIAEDIGSNPVQAWIFFRPYFHYCSSSVHYWEDYFHIHIFIHSSNIWLSFIHSRLSSIVWGKKSQWKSWFQCTAWRFGGARIEAITLLNFFFTYALDFSQKEGLQIVYCQSQVFHFSFLGLRPVWLIRLCSSVRHFTLTRYLFSQE